LKKNKINQENIIEVIMNESSVFELKVEWWAFFISILALFFTLLKDYIIPFLIRPKMVFYYDNRPPYKRDFIQYNLGSGYCYGDFFRIEVKNIGSSTAKNCRCQIYDVLNLTSSQQVDLAGYTLKWASRPDFSERLEIHNSEREFIDIVFTKYNGDEVYLPTYHKIAVGMNGVLKKGKYQVILLFTGDNFSPYEITIIINNLGIGNQLGLHLDKVVKLEKY